MKTISVKVNITKPGAGYRISAGESILLDFTVENGMTATTAGLLTPFDLPSLFRDTGVRFVLTPKCLALLADAK